MKWSLSVGRLFGIDIRVHVTFFVLLVWIIAARWVAEESPAAGVAGMVLVLLIFSLVVLHELGHALMARRFGISTPDITLLPIGGVARLERMPDVPVQELLVALAGPAVNVALALLLGATLVFTGHPLLAADPLDLGVPLIVQLFWINVALAVFNMIPAFPMDGGRVLRALLAMFMPSLRATELAARLGQTIAAVFGLVGIFYHPILAFIALFVWLGAGAEAKLARMRSRMQGITVEQVMRRRFRVLHPHDPLTYAADLLLQGFQGEYFVEEGGRVVGLLRRSDLMRALAKRDPRALVMDAMVMEFPHARSDEMVIDVFERLARSPHGVMPVVNHGMMVGMLTAEGLGDMLAMHEAMAPKRERSIGTRHRRLEQPS